MGQVIPKRAPHIGKRPFAKTFDNCENLAAVFGVADAPRTEAAQAVKELRSYGVETVMLTGDRSTTAKAIAKMLNITNIKAELLPEDKVPPCVEVCAL